MLRRCGAGAVVGQHAEPVSEHVLQHQADQERRRADADQRRADGGVVPRGAALHRGQQAEADADEELRQDRREGELRRAGMRRGEQVDDGLAIEEAEAEIDVQAEGDRGAAPVIGVPLGRR